MGLEDCKGMLDQAGGQILTEDGLGFLGKGEVDPVRA